MASNRKIHGSSYGDGSKKPVAAASASSSRKRKNHVEIVSSEKRTKSSRSSPYYVCDGVFRVSNTSDVNNLYDTQDQIDLVFLNVKGQREIDTGRAASNLEEKGLRYKRLKKKLVIVTSLEDALKLKRKEYACIPKNTTNWKEITKVLKDKKRWYTSIDERAEKSESDSESGSA